jgi:biotin carboxylase
MAAALGDTHVGGINTTVGICRAIMRDPRFREGSVGIDYLPAFVAGAAASR